MIVFEWIPVELSLPSMAAPGGGTYTSIDVIATRKRVWRANVELEVVTLMFNGVDFVDDECRPIRDVIAWALRPKPYRP